MRCWSSAGTQKPCGLPCSPGVYAPPRSMFSRHVFLTLFRDGSKILTSSDDGSARLWSVESGQQLKVFQGHSKKLCCATFSNDETMVLTCSEATPVHPRSTRVWSRDSGELLVDADKTAAESTSRHMSQGAVGCESVFSPDGLHVVRQRPAAFCPTQPFTLFLAF